MFTKLESQNIGLPKSDLLTVLKVLACVHTLILIIVAALPPHQ